LPKRRLGAPLGRAAGDNWEQGRNCTQLHAVDAHEAVQEIGKAMGKAMGKAEDALHKALCSGRSCLRLGLAANCTLIALDMHTASSAHSNQFSLAS